MPDDGTPYSKDELLATGPQPTYTGRHLDEIAFPLGGIGTGTISPGGWGLVGQSEGGDGEHTLTVHLEAGELTLARIETPLAAEGRQAATALGDAELAAAVEPGAILFDPPATVPGGQTLEIALAG